MRGEAIASLALSRFQTNSSLPAIRWSSAFWKPNLFNQRTAASLAASAVATTRVSPDVRIISIAIRPAR